MMRSDNHYPYRGRPEHVSASLPTKYRPSGPKCYQNFRFDRTEIRPLTYKPNGDREVWRRRRQLKSGFLKAS